VGTQQKGMIPFFDTQNIAHVMQRIPFYMALTQKIAYLGRDGLLAICREGATIVRLSWDVCLDEAT
jgi:hypothetical protein